MDPVTALCCGIIVTQLLATKVKQHKDNGSVVFHNDNGPVVVSVEDWAEEGEQIIIDCYEGFFELPSRGRNLKESIEISLVESGIARWRTTALTTTGQLITYLGDNEFGNPICEIEDDDNLFEFQATEKAYQHGPTIVLDTADQFGWLVETYETELEFINCGFGSIKQSNLWINHPSTLTI